MFLKTCSFWKSFKNVIQVVDFRSRNSGNSCISERSLKNVIQVVDSEHRKVHFLKSDFFELSKRKVRRVMQAGAQSYAIEVRVVHKNHPKTLEIHVVSGKVAGAGDI